MVVDLEDGEVGVVEEALLGRRTSHKKPLLGVSQRATIGRYRWTLYTSKEKRTLLSEGGPSYD